MDKKTRIRIMTRFIILICIASFFLSGCKRDRANSREEKIAGNSGLQVLSIDLETRKSLKFSQIFDLCDVVRLETKNIHNLIRDVNKIRINSEWIVIFSDPLVYVFLRDGSLYKKLELYGRGPGETTMPLDMQVDFENEYIYILAVDRKSILVYSFEGEFVSEFIHGSYAYGFTILDSGEALIYNAGQNIDANDSGDGLVYFVNEESGVMSSFIPIVKNLQRLYQSVPMEMFNTHFSGQVSFKMTYYDTIYLFDAGQKALLPAYYLDFNGANVDYSDFWNEAVSLSDLSRDSKSYVTRCSNQRYIGDKLSLNASYGDEFVNIQILYDFSDQKSIVIERVCNDFIGDSTYHGIQRYDRLYGNYDEFGVLVVDPFQLIRSINSLDEGSKKSLFTRHEKIGRIYKEIEEEDNPILMIVSIKDL